MFHFLRSEVSIIFLLVYFFNIFFFQSWNKQRTMIVKYLLQVFVFIPTYIIILCFSVYEHLSLRPDSHSFLK